MVSRKASISIRRASSRLSAKEPKNCASSKEAKKQKIYAQGAPCDAVFYIQKGRVRLTVVSKNGKEATLGILNRAISSRRGLAGQHLRMGSAIAMSDCELMRIDKKAMMLALHRGHALSDMFVAY